MSLPLPWPDVRGNGEAAVQQNFEKISTEWRGVSSWQSYTPTITTATLGTGGTNVARFQRTGSTVTAAGVVTFGTGGSFTGGAVTFSLPVASGAASQFLGQALATDNATGSYTGVVFVGVSASTFAVFLGTGTGATTIVGATTPFTWGNADWLCWTVTYEAAS